VEIHGAEKRLVHNFNNWKLRTSLKSLTEKIQLWDLVHLYYGFILQKPKVNNYF